MGPDLFRPLRDAVHAMLAKHASGEGTLVVGVSGGVDSMVLLHLVADVAHDLGLRPHAAHVHHGLRKSADEDAALVMQTAHAWGLSAEVRRVDLSTIPAADRRGTEADARLLRRQALRDAAASVGARVILLAHHADDQLETMLWRLMRGTSLEGLAGMRPVRHEGGITWLRPLLAFEKSILSDYARAHAIPWREDESNRDPTYLRNALRHQVIPLLKRLQPALAQSAARLATVLQAENDWMEASARAWVQAHVQHDPGGRVVRMAVADLSGAPVALQRRAIHILLTCFLGADASYHHVESVLGLAAGGGASREVALPGGVYAWRRYDVLCIGERDPHIEAEDAPELHWNLAHHGRIHWHAGTMSWSFQCRRWTRETAARPLSIHEGGAHRWSLWLPADVRQVIIRPWRAGDRVAPLGMNGRKKLQDLFVDAKVPRDQRHAWPVVCDVEGTILWIPGLARSRYRLVTEDTTAGWRIEAGASPREDGVNFPQHTLNG